MSSSNKPQNHTVIIVILNNTNSNNSSKIHSSNNGNSSNSSKKAPIVARCLQLNLCAWMQPERPPKSPRRSDSAGVCKPHAQTGLLLRKGFPCIQIKFLNCNPENACTILQSPQSNGSAHRATDATQQI